MMTSARGWYDIRLRDGEVDDLPLFFEHQRDPEANWMAAFTRKDPADRDAFMAHWTKILEDEANTIQTILFNGSVAGSVSSYVDEDEHLEVTYWIGKPYWGKGIATCALSAFLEHNKVRPLYARAAADNAASLRVLEKCGLVPMRTNRDFANARGQEIEEVLLKLP